VLSSDKVSIKFLGQANAGYRPATAFVDMQMLGGFSIISSYAEMKMEALSMANGCGSVSRKEQRVLAHVGVDEGMVDLQTISRL
jgi:hypothetical protein